MRGDFVLHVLTHEHCQIDDRSVFVHRFYYDGDGPDDEDGNPGGLAFLAVPSGVHNYSHGVPMDIWDGGFPFRSTVSLCL